MIDGKQGLYNERLGQTRAKKHAVCVSIHVLDLRAAAEEAGVDEQPPQRGVEWLAQNREPPCALCLKIHSVNTAGGISVLR